jgi:hypothetical protein
VYKQPLEFVHAGFLGDFKSSDGKSWRGPCPLCGGNRRFLVFTDRPYPSWNFQCNLCDYKGWVDQLLAGDSHKPTEEEILAWLEKQELERKERERKQRLAQDRFQQSALWEEAHHNLDEQSRRWWSKRGLPQEWQEYWTLGTTIRVFYPEDERGNLTPLEHRVFTIPKYQTGMDRPTNVDMRLDDPVPSSLSKYMGLPNLPPALFVSHPHWQQLTMDGTVLVVEGSIKAMVTALHCPHPVQVLAVPAARSWVNVIDLLRNADNLQRVVVMLDPDAQVPAQELVEEIGERAYRLALPVKIDDAFLRYGLTGDRLFDLLRQARRR